jgi:hypothetical protein
MFHLLGEWRETSAYPVLARLLRLPGEDMDEILGDAVTKTSHRVMAAVFDGGQRSCGTRAARRLEVTRL